ncbi:hypothetical protein JCM5350_000766 [Sporobolomyces pararoseus]
MSNEHTAHDVWPPGQEHLRPIVATGYLISVAVLSALLSRRWISWTQMKRLPVAKLLVITVLGDSLLFTFASAILILGIGTSFSSAACKLGIWWCIILYASSKVLIYSFLSEKLYAVYSVTPTRRIPRWQSTQYKIAMAFLVLWLGVAVVMIVGRIAEIRAHDNACVIGLKLYSTVPMLTVDAIVNIYLTAAFVLPVYRSRWHKAQKLAFNSCLAAIASLVTSFVNIAILTAQHGHQLSWVCLGSCSLDVCLNAIILYIVTASSSSSSNSVEEYTAGQGNNNKHVSSVIRSHVGGGGATVNPATRQSHLFSATQSTSFGKQEFSTTSTHEIRPPLTSNVESDVTFDSKYSLEPPSTTDETAPSTATEIIATPTLSYSPSFPPHHSSPTLPRSPKSSSSSSSPNRSRSRTASSTAAAGGILVSEEIVTVAETGLSPDELREEEEWLRRGRQSRMGSGNGSSGALRGLESLSRIENRS